MWDNADMITVLLIRHGIAEDLRSGLRDADRGLTAEGWERTRAAMRGLVRRGYVPSRGVSSPYRRAAETLVCLKEATPEGFPSGCWDGLVPSASAEAARSWLELVVGQAHPFDTLALVSHQPLCSDLVQVLTGRLVDFKKASAAVIHWNAGRFELAAHFAPAELRGDV
jgi:phosphohistidine phosphatase